MSIDAVRSRISEIQSSLRNFQPNIQFPTVTAGAQGRVSAQGVSGSFDTALANATSAPSGVDPAQFSRDVLSRIGAPATAQNMAVMQAWIKAEGTKAQFNPLATVRRAPGATDFNSVGVKNFVSYDQGVDTTVGAITNGLYDDVIAALRRGNDAYAVADAIEASPWGTGGLVRKVLDSNRA
jgi:hypothetical protein